jgi:hypothetical protein
MPDGDGLVCSFCGQRRTGGVSGPAAAAAAGGSATRVYICPDCIRSSREELRGESGAEAPPPPEGA